jgi:iduronate 2-sulfatase
MKRILIFSTILFLSSGELHALSKPNVLLLLVDDLKPAMGCYGDKHAITPHMDTLSKRGVRFDLAYCNQAVCAPSRFTLMLGAHSTSTGLYGLGSHLRQVMPNAVTMSQYFSLFGYRAESLGKVFHIGHGNLGDPQAFEVPHFHDKVIEYLVPESTDGGKLTREEALFTNQKLGQIRSLPRGAAFEAPVVNDEGYADGRVANETIKRLKAAKERRAKEDTPFFIAAGFVRPHLPFSAPKRYWDMHDSAKLPLADNKSFPKNAPRVALKSGGEISAFKPVPPGGKIEDDLARKLIHGYYASTTYVDAQIGKVTRALERLGLAENTIVVLWGDHGWHLGDLSIWTKHTNFEQANRIPIMIIAPGVTKKGVTTKQLAETVDIFPTLAELAGLPEPKVPQSIDGVSLVPVLIDPLARVRDHAFHAYPRGRKLGRAIRTERYRFVEWKNHSDATLPVDYELYDYEADPWETQNHYAAKPDVAKKLKAILDKYPAPKTRK